MIVYSLLTITILLACFSLFIARRCGLYYSPRNLGRLLLSVSSAVFIYLYGAWVFISIYTKFVFAVSFVVVLVYSFITRRKPLTGGQSVSIPGMFFTLIFIVLSVLYFMGTTDMPYGIASLALPLKNGRYFVFQGGKGLPTNIFHYKLRGAVFAMDIVKLNCWGNRAKHIFSANLDDYEIFNDTLYSPCNGTVVHTEDSNPDNIPPGRKRGPKNTNSILIQTDSSYVFMAHLRKGCVFVHEGQQVSTGQPIGCCGNSGFSLEPHLHIQVHVRTNSGIPWYKEKPLLITFGDKYYNLFEEIQ